jgi:hypothetical protein
VEVGFWRVWLWLDLVEDFVEFEDVRGVGVRLICGGFGDVGQIIVDGELGEFALEVVVGDGSGVGL